MAYRTKTYLAGDWTGDKDAIDKIHEWNDSDYRSRLDSSMSTTSSKLGIQAFPAQSRVLSTTE